MRLSLTDVATTEDVRDIVDLEELEKKVDHLTELVERLSARLDREH